MTANNQTQLGSTLWKIAGELLRALKADQFCDYKISFLPLSYLSDNYKVAAKRGIKTYWVNMFKSPGPYFTARIDL